MSHSPAILPTININGTPVDLNTCEPKLRLHYALKAETLLSEDTFAKIFRAGVSFKTQDELKRTPLHYLFLPPFCTKAPVDLYQKMLETILRQSISVTADDIKLSPLHQKDSKQHTPTYYALVNGKRRFLENYIHKLDPTDPIEKSLPFAQDEKEFFASLKTSDKDLFSSSPSLHPPDPKDGHCYHVHPFFVMHSQECTARYQYSHNPAFMPQTSH